MSIEIYELDETGLRIVAPEGILRQISYHYTFEVPGAKFTPLYKLGHWDGKIRLFRNNVLPKGLFIDFIKLIKEENWDIINVDITLKKDDRDPKDFVSSLKLPFEPRDYQMDILSKSMVFPRQVFLSPTASGKSFAQYLIARRFKRTLIIVPSISLVEQMASDFAEYDIDKEIRVAKDGGKNKDDIHDADVVVSTWQSCMKWSAQDLNSFDCILGDECHRFEAKSLSNIMNKANKVHFRYGFTGTINDAKMHELSLMALFGPVRKVVSTRDLIDRNLISNLDIIAKIVKYPIVDCKRRKYHDEVKFISEHPERNAYLVRLIDDMPGVTLVLTRYVKHCRQLFDDISVKNKFMITGALDSTQREEIRQAVMKSDQAVIVATYGTMSTGVNIPNIQNLVLASPLKTKITLLQSIGRGLRLHESKIKLNVYDIVDDMSKGKYKNFALKHFISRLQIYRKEKFIVQTKEICI